MLELLGSSANLIWSKIKGIFKKDQYNYHHKGESSSGMAVASKTTESNLTEGSIPSSPAKRKRLNLRQ